jgi:hypothetical protein
MVSKLPDGNGDAKTAGDVSDGLKEAAASFFRSNEESVGRFCVILHKSCLVNVCAPYATTVPHRMEKLQDFDLE